MPIAQVATRIAFRHILYLTDFSPVSDAAIPLLKTMATHYHSDVLVFNVLLPIPIVYASPNAIDAILRGEEEGAQIGMNRIRPQLEGLPHQLLIEHGAAIWPSVERAIERHSIDLIVLGTHGRSGGERLMLGSVAEEVFRRATVPVITIGPHAMGTELKNLRTVLFAADFAQESLAAAPYAVSVAEENHARLILLHVTENEHRAAAPAQLSEAAIRMNLRKLVPTEAQLGYAPEALVRHGDPVRQILRAAGEEQADLIVMGVRNAEGHMVAATHLERPIAHQVVAQATCPVLTVRA